MFTCEKLSAPVNCSCSMRYSCAQVIPNLSIYLKGLDYFLKLINQFYNYLVVEQLIINE